MKSAEENCLLSSLLQDVEIIPFFQPIINIKTGRVFAYESLVRGRCKSTGKLISPVELFELTDSHKVTREFDQLCQRLTLESFKKYESNALLLMNNQGMRMDQWRIHRKRRCSALSKYFARRY